VKICGNEYKLLYLTPNVAESNVCTGKTGLHNALKFDINECQSNSFNWGGKVRTIAIRAMVAIAAIEP